MFHFCELLSNSITSAEKIRKNSSQKKNEYENLTSTTTTTTKQEISEKSESEDRNRFLESLYVVLSSGLEVILSKIHLPFNPPPPLVQQPFISFPFGFGGNEKRTHLFKSKTEMIMTSLVSILPNPTVLPPSFSPKILVSPPPNIHLFFSIISHLSTLAITFGSLDYYAPALVVTNQIVKMILKQLKQVGPVSFLIGVETLVPIMTPCITYVNLLRKCDSKDWHMDWNGICPHCTKIFEECACGMGGDEGLGLGGGGGGGGGEGFGGVDIDDSMMGDRPKEDEIPDIRNVNKKSITEGFCVDNVALLKESFVMFFFSLQVFLFVLVNCSFFTHYIYLLFQVFVFF
jgi:hypothetical protein